MGNREQKLKGAVEEVAGKLKAGLGRAVGSRQLEAEGQATEEKGKTRQEAAKAGERIAGSLRAAGGKVQKAAGRLLGDREIEAEGVANQVKGNAKVRANKPGSRG
jgi:uncharacterized protein YjbJ (UPF0337 family)